MDPGLLLGLLLAFGALLAMVFMEGSELASLLLPAPMILVFGATIAVAVASGTLRDAVAAAKSLPKAFVGRAPKPADAIAMMVEIAATARKNGLIKLEAEAKKVDDPFLSAALMHVADGVDADELRIVLEDQVATKANADMAAARFYNRMGGYAPTIGIIGTVVALTHVLGNLSSPDTLGPAIATAFVATLWGLLSANFIWLPIGARLARLSVLETDHMTLLAEGALAVQGGCLPRLMEEKLRAMVSANNLPAAA